MKTIQKLLAIVSLLAVTVIGSASTISYTSTIEDSLGYLAAGDIFLTVGGGPLQFSGNFTAEDADTGAVVNTDSVFFGLTIGQDAGVLAGGASVNFDLESTPSVTSDPVMLNIYQDLGDGIFSRDGMGMDMLIAGSLGNISALLTSGTLYFLEVVTTVEANLGFTGEIAAVPVPAAGILFASALLGAGALGRRKKKTVKPTMTGAFARAV